MTEARYPHVHVGAAAEDVELITATLWDLGASGIEERDATTLTASRPEDGAVMLIASFDDESEAQAAVQALGARWPARVEFVIGDAWRDGWKEFFRPLQIGRRLVIETPWAHVERRPDDVVVTLDPGYAFGTGQHESTRLLLEQLDERVVSGVRVLDVGCGSGILAIAALRLGAVHARALDVDPDAVRATLDNARENEVAAMLEASTAPVEAAHETYPLVVANIEAGVLIGLAPALVRCVVPGGLLMLSGILAESEARVRAAYASFELIVAPRAGEWVALVLRRAP